MEVHSATSLLLAQRPMRSLHRSDSMRPHPCLSPVRPDSIGTLNHHRVDTSRHIRHSWHSVLDDVRVGELLPVVNEFFSQRCAEPLCRCTEVLAFHHRGVDGMAYVADRDEVFDGDLTSVRDRLLPRLRPSRSPRRAEALEGHQSCERCRSRSPHPSDRQTRLWITSSYGAESSPVMTEPSAAFTSSTERWNISAPISSSLESASWHAR